MAPISAATSDRIVQARHSRVPASPSTRSRSSGNRETSEIDILDRLGLDGWTSLIGFDAEAARERIADTALGRRSLRYARSIRDTLEVRIEEREPFAHLAARQRRYR